VRSRSTNRPVWAQGERGSAPRRSAHMTRRCAVRFEEGSRPPKVGANLHSSRPGPGTRASSEARRERLVSPCRPREGAAEGQGCEGWSPFAGRMRGIDALAVSARASSYCRSRWNAFAPREARHRHRAGRKPDRYTERVDGGSATSMHRARERKVLLLVKRGRLIEARRSSSRERRAIDQDAVGSSAFRCGRVAR